MRHRRSRFGAILGFWKHVNEFYCWWWFRLRRAGPCTIPPSGPVLIVANHRCSIDPLLLTAASPNRVMAFLVAREYVRLPIAGRFMRLIGCIPVDRSAPETGSVRSALRLLEGGGALGVFPEGGIPAPGEAVAAKEGVAMLALRSRAPVVPAHVSGTRYSDGVLAPLFRRHRAVVRYGPAIDLSVYRDRPRDRGVYREVTELIMRRIEELAP